jgi:hypothetical protein
LKPQLLAEPGKIMQSLPAIGDVEVRHMLDTMSCLDQFALAAREHIDLSVQTLGGHPAGVRVRNRFSDTLMEVVTCTPEGVYLTSWGYRLGTVDNVEDAAARLAYLLAALPS